MDIDIKFSYFDKEMSDTSISIAIDGVVVFDGEFYWFNIFMQSLLSVFFDGQSEEHVYYMPNDENAILVRSYSGTFELLMAREMRARDFTNQLIGDWHTFRKIPRSIAIKMSTYSSVNMKNEIFIIVYLCMACKYMDDYGVYFNSRNKDEFEQYKEFFQKFKCDVKKLFASCGDITEKTNVCIESGMLNEVNMVKTKCSYGPMLISNGKLVGFDPDN